jgi:hypothetical protein
MLNFSIQKMTLKFIITIQNISHYSNVTWVSNKFVFWSNTTWQNTKGTLWLGIMKTPHILDINIRRMLVSTFMIWLSFCNGNSPIYLLDSRVNGPQSKWWQKDKFPYFALFVTSYIRVRKPFFFFGGGGGLIEGKWIVCYWDNSYKCQTIAQQELSIHMPKQTL